MIPSGDFVDLPPAFPEWLKRRLPALRAEETNWLFHAFRERRLRTGWRRNWFGTWGICATRGWIALPMAGLLFALWHVYDVPYPVVPEIAFGVVVWTLLIGSGAYAFVSFVRRYTASGEEKMPLLLAELLDGGRTVKGPIIDIYLCGYAGGDIAEALILERMERTWRFYSFLVCTMVVSPYLFLAAVPRNDWGPVGLGFAVGSLPLSYALLTATPGGILNTHASKWTKRLLDRWEARSVVVQDAVHVRDGIGKGCLISGLVVVLSPIVVWVLVLILGAVFELFRTLPIPEIPALIRGALSFLIAAGICGVPGVVVAMRRASMDAQAVKAVSGAMVRADYSFRILFRCRLLEDPDGWPGWRDR